MLEPASAEITAFVLDERGGPVKSMSMALILAVSMLGCGEETAQSDRDGDGSVTAQDCDDDDPTIHPGAEELCNGVDDDCDGVVDDDDATDAATWYAETDGDGYGDAAVAANACEAPDGFVSDDTDCDDGDPAVYPGAEETCNDKDDDCDGVVDGNEATDVTTWYADADGDGYGDVTVTESACDAPEGFVADDTDCDDSDSTVNPGATEILYDGVDQDCAEGSEYDGDGDGYDHDSHGGDDCDDSDENVHPGADEMCEDAVDTDCDGDASSGEEDCAAWSAWLQGIDASDYAGMNVGPAGDVDGDGSQDLLVYASGASGGTAYLMGGPFTGEISLTEALATFTPTGVSNPGRALLGAGDTNSDGFDDFWVTSGSTSSWSAGRAYLYLGPVSGELEVADSEIYLYKDGSGSDYPCTSWDCISRLANAGDMNEDGVADLLVGLSTEAETYHASWPGGAVRLVHGPFDERWNIDDSPRLALDTAGTYLGGSVDGGVDVDGDGVPDVLTSAPGENGPNNGAGYVFVARGPITSDVSLWDAETIYTGEYDYDTAGSSLAFAGDTDEDGNEDIVIGATYGYGDGDDNGVVYLASAAAEGTFSLADATARLLGTASVAVGGGVAGLGDVNGDGPTDIVIRGSDAAYVFLGPVEGTLPITDADLRLPLPADAAPTGVRGPGDLDGDGLDDLIVSAYSDDTAPTNAGAVYIMAGASLE